MFLSSDISFLKVEFSLILLYIGVYFYAKDLIVVRVFLLNALVKCVSSSSLVYLQMLTMNPQCHLKQCPSELYARLLVFFCFFTIKYVHGHAFTGCTEHCDSQ